MANKWVAHVKQWAKKNNTTYGCAISDPNCAKDYKGGKPSGGVRKTLDLVPLGELMKKRKEKEMNT